MGKSTLLQKLITAYLARHPGPVGGFYTKRVYGVLPELWTVHLLAADHSDVPCAENMLFVCRQPAAEDAGRFDLLGCTALEKARRAPCAVIVMDELGVYEKDAHAFHAAVLQALDGDKPILGVLQKGESAFLDAVAAHPRVQVLPVDSSNRDSVNRFLAYL